MARGSQKHGTQCSCIGYIGLRLALALSEQIVLRMRL